MRVTTAGLFIETASTLVVSIGYRSVSTSGTELVERVTTGGARQLLSVPGAGTSYELDDLYVTNPGGSAVTAALHWGTDATGPLLKNLTIAAGDMAQWVSGAGWL